MGDRAFERLLAGASDADVAACDELLAASFPPSYGAYDLRAELARPHGRLWVCRPMHGAAPVSFVLGWHVVDEVEILLVATAPGERKKGHADALLSWLWPQVAGAGVGRVLLEVRRSNTPAIALYRRHAFHVNAVRPRYYDDGEDAVMMALRLTADGAPVRCDDEEPLG